MDGPVFHTANELMIELKKSKFYFQSKVGDELMDSAIFGQINVLILIKNDWTKKQLSVIKKYKGLGNQSWVANVMDITPQAISKSLDRSNYKKISKIEKKLDMQFERFEEKNL